MSERTRRELILDTVDDCVTDLLFYDRKEDEDLEVGAIEEAIAAAEITAGEMVEYFKTKLLEGLAP